MRFVHSLLKVESHHKVGWRAPSELTSDSPRHVSFVIPMPGDSAERNYACDVIQILESGKRSVQRHEITRIGSESFFLNVAGRELWFHDAPVSPREKLLPYTGHLVHPDFEWLLLEIEPEKQSILDELCAQAGMFVIGCDPATNYRIGKSASRSRDISAP